MCGIPRACSEPRGQDLHDVYEKNVLINGRNAVLPHCGHATVALSCSLIERVTVTSPRHSSQYSTRMQAWLLLLELPRP
jgi:hypothetical protein